MAAEEKQGQKAIQLTEKEKEYWEDMKKGLEPLAARLNAAGHKSLYLRILSMRDTMGHLLESTAGTENDFQLRQDLERMGALLAEISEPEEDELLTEAALEADKELPALKGAALRAVQEVKWLRGRMETLKRELKKKRRYLENEAIAKAEIRKQQEGGMMHGTPGFQADLMEILIRKLQKEPEKEEKEIKEPENTEEKPPKKMASLPAKEKKQKTPGAEETVAPTPNPTPTPEEKQPEPEKALQLIAHCAAAFQEDPRFFKNMMKSAQEHGADARPEDMMGTAQYETAMTKLRRRLVNLEMKTRSLAEAAGRGEPVSSLLQSAAREAKGFVKEFGDGKKQFPEKADAIDRVFGGVVKNWAAMKLDKGGKILEMYQAEKTAKKAAPKAAEEEAEIKEAILVPQWNRPEE